MTDQFPNDPARGFTSDSAEPGAQASPETEAPAEGGSARAREWVAQLEAMIQQISTQAAPVARQVGAKAAELAAIAAVKAGPVAHKAADLTTDYGSRFAEKAQSVAAELRAHDAAAGDAAPAGGAEVPAAEDTAGTGL